MVLHRLFVLLCLVAIVACAETKTNTHVESDQKLNPNSETQNSIDDSTHISALTVLEEAPSGTSTTQAAVDQSSDSPRVIDPTRTQTELTSKSVENETGPSGTSSLGISQTQSAFNRLMTRIHQAIDKEQWEEAIRSLDEAEKLNPNSDAAKDLRDFVAMQREQLHQQILAEKFAKAIDHEEWTEASKIAANMKTQDTVVLTQIRRSKTLIEVEELTERLVASPERLSRPSIQAEVSRLRSLIADVEPGERISDKLARLNEMSQLWTTPVTISLNSDGYTTVILRPGRSLGRFRTQTVQLMPGEYELIGRRDGFREVRRSLLLNPKSEPTTVEIKASQEF